MSRNWKNQYIRVKHEGQIILKIYDSREGLTFGELLKATGLSKPVLSQHLKRMMEPVHFRRISYDPTIVHVGWGTNGRYKLTPSAVEDVEREGGFIAVYPLPKKKRSRAKAERYIEELHS